MSTLESIEQIAKEQGMAPEDVLDTLIREMTLARDLVVAAQEKRNWSEL
jgi:hypothetical protein